MSTMNGKLQQDTSIVFEKLRFQRIVKLQRDKNIHFIIHIQKGSGNFEIIENGQIVFSGRVYVPDDIDKEMMYVPNCLDFNNDDEIQLDTEDVYKEFGLRGYGYTGVFRQIISCTNTGMKSRVKWNENWAAFLDTITQIHILHTDTRNPCLLTGIDKLVINLRKHQQTLESITDQNKGVPVYVHKELGLIEAGGIQIKGVSGHVTHRRKLQKEPQLLSHKFTPYINNKTEMTLTELACFCAHTLCENILSVNIKILEYGKEDGKDFLAPIICQCLNDFPHIQVNAVIIHDDPESINSLNKSYITVETSRSRGEGDTVHLVIVNNVMRDKQQIENSLEILTDGGFIMVRMKLNETLSFTNLTVCCETVFQDEKFILLRRKYKSIFRSVCLEITKDYSWVKKLKDHIKCSREVILFAERDACNGILGFYNCLKKEVSNNRIKCYFIVDQDAPPFNTDDEFYKSQIEKNFNVNVYKNKTWGCYVHFPLDKLPLIKTPHAYVNVGAVGDLRTLNWYQGNLTDQSNGRNTAGKKLIQVYYSALNFKDVLLATGALSYEGFTDNRKTQECLIGCEFSGRDSNGKRYMGMHPAAAISTMLSAFKQFIWEIPDHWSLEEAATIPIVYLTVISAFFVHGNLKTGESVLIHSGAGGVGQAAINIATYYKCNIFTTVGTPQKRDFLRKQFPHIENSHIGNSRDTTFEHLIMKETNGKGVDLVLNSLAEDKLQASVRCLAKGGRFLEIGKLDLFKDNQLGLKVFLRGISFHCILLDRIHTEKEDKKNLILHTFERELKAGSIKPIIRTVFEEFEVEKAFRFMTAGKHIGKVLIRIRTEEENINALPKVIYKEAVPRFQCCHEKVYIICGGLGGMGLELSDWLVLRGATKLILTSRTGATTGYQRMRINLWKSYGTTTVISTADLSKKTDVEDLLQNAEIFGSVDAIFNLAAITDDKLFDDQDENSFETVAVAKITATSLLDQISRKLCPNLQHFVVFSSVSCGYGNAAQTNYGYVNSVCERICEHRREQGLPALAIQWGVVGDVGMLSKLGNAEKSFGLKEQPIRSCLSVMDKFLNQPEAVVSSYIMGDKNTNNVKNDTLVESIANILGIQDLKTISMYSPLPELGMDSISGLEIKQTLEQQCDIFLSPKEIISLTFAQLEEIQKTGKKSTVNIPSENNIVASMPYVRNILLTKPHEINLVTLETIVKMPSLFKETNENASSNTVFFFPSMEGISEAMKSLSRNLNMKTLCFQYFGITQADSLEEQAQFFASYIEQTIPETEAFNIVAYSYGVLLALEAIKILESKNRTGRVVLIDGSIEYTKFIRSFYFGNMTDITDIQTKVIMDIIATFQPAIVNNQLKTDLDEKGSWESKLDYVVTLFPDNLPYKKNLRIMTNFIYDRYKSLHNHRFQVNNLFKTKAAFIKAKKTIFPLPNDPGLQKYFANPLEEYSVDENHFTILDNKKTAEIVERVLQAKLH